MSYICENETVIVRSVDDKSSYIVKVAGDQKIGKARVHMKALVGKPYGSVFELVNRSLVHVVDTTKLSGVENYQTYENSDEQATEESAEKSATTLPAKGDNSFYVDTNTAQKLTDTDIKQLRQSGSTGGEIIQTLINNSETFATKTDFAQEKWIKRKERKYKKTYKILKCSPFNVCDATFTKSRDKICGMRPDSLAQIISQSGIHSGSRVLVVESTVGMVVGSLAYRMRGNGRILAVYGGQQPHFDIVHNFNLDLASKNIIQPVPATELGPAAQYVAASGFLGEEETLPVEGSSEVAVSELAAPVAEETQPNKRQKTEDSESAATSMAVDSEEVVEMGEVEVKQRRQAKGGAVHNTGKGKESNIRLRTFLRQGVDSLIIAAKYRPLPILKQALLICAPSTPFVIFHEYMEPLVECYLYLQQSTFALKLVLSDTWMREFQTLPGRVRPDMFMDTSGGYILSGIYVGMVKQKEIKPDNDAEEVLELIEVDADEEGKTIKV